MEYKADEELIAQTLDGSTAAFDTLMRKHQDMVFRVGMSFGKNKDNALDITQNVFLKTYENLRMFRGKSSFKTWLMRIAYNEGNNWIRKHKRETDDETFEEEIMITPNTPTQEDDLLARENRSMLLRCLLNLNTKYRLAVVLRYFEDKSIREIAGIIGCSEGMVKNMLFRSLQKLRESLTLKQIGDVA